MFILREQNLTEILDMMFSGGKLREKLPECPVRRSVNCPVLTEIILQVCYEKFTKNSQVFQCREGHFVCGSCRPGVEVRKCGISYVLSDPSYLRSVPPARGG